MNEENRQGSSKTCAIYTHTSNPGGVGINYQIAICRAYANQQGWSIADDHVFIDKGTRDFNRRSGFKALLRTVRDGERRIDIVLVDEGHRFSRMPIETESAVSALRNLGAEVRIAFELPARQVPGNLEIAELGRGCSSSTTQPPL